MDGICEHEKGYNRWQLTRTNTYQLALTCECAFSPIYHCILPLCLEVLHTRVPNVLIGSGLFIFLECASIRRRGTNAIPGAERLAHVRRLNLLLQWKNG